MAHLFMELQYGNNPPDLKQYISLNNEAKLSLLISASISTSSVGFVIHLSGQVQLLQYLPKLHNY